MAFIAKDKNVFSDIDIRKLKQYATPVGIATSAFITEPSTEFDKDGQYFLRLKLPANDKGTMKLIYTIDTARKEAYETAMAAAVTPKEQKAVTYADPSYKVEEDDEGNETGYIIFNFKRRAIRTDKKGNVKPVVIPLFDSVGQPVDREGLDIWSGSELSVAFKLVPFFVGSVGVGVSHRIEAIQLIKVVSGGDGQTAEQYGFSKKAVGGFRANIDEDEVAEEAPVPDPRAKGIVYDADEGEL